MKYNLNGLNVVLTGASGGFGKEITKILVSEFNCKVIGIGRNEEAMIKTAEMLADKKSLFSYELFDITSEEKWSSFARKLEDNNIIPDMLINCAGTLPPYTSFAKSDKNTAENTMNTNFFSAVNAIQSMMPILIKSENPAIINISSSAALCPTAGAAAYSASKGALKNFTEALREELRGKIYVALICPGFSVTGILRNQTNVPERKLLDLVSTPPDKIARKTLRAVSRKRPISLCGADAAFMSISYRLMPVLSVRFFRWVLKKSGLSLFKDI